VTNFFWILTIFISEQTMDQSHMAINLTEEVAFYMQTSFKNKLHALGDKVNFPHHWSVDFLYECDIAVDILFKAILNKSYFFFFSFPSS
jgi:hypothetical protein